MSGGMLSDALGVSRVSIKKHMDHLISDGYVIEAVRNRGYCLKLEPDSFNELGFRLYGDASIAAGSVFCYKNIDSTNTEVDRLLNNGEDAPVVAIAQNQSSGKGRRGNQWVSETEKNLYLSIGFRPNIEATRIGQYTLWIGLCLAEFLKQETGLDLKVKWPNDLYLSGKKVAGILSEAKIDMDHIQHLIVGLGLNINAGMDAFPEDLKAKASSLKIERGSSLHFNRLAAAITSLILRESERYFETPMEDVIQGKWDDFDFLRGKRVIAKGIRQSTEGVACGIDSSGHLLIKLDNGDKYAVNSGEVTMAFE